MALSSEFVSQVGCIFLNSNQTKIHAPFMVTMDTMAIYSRRSREPPGQSYNSVASRCFVLSA